MILETALVVGHLQLVAGKSQRLRVIRELSGGTERGRLSTPGLRDCRRPEDRRNLPAGLRSQSSSVADRTRDHREQGQSHHALVGARGLRSLAHKRSQWLRQLACGKRRPGEIVFVGLRLDRLRGHWLGRREHLL